MNERFLTPEQIARLAWERTSIRVRPMRREDAMLDYIQQHHYHIVSVDIREAIQELTVPCGTTLFTQHPPEDK